MKIGILAPGRVAEKMMKTLEVLEEVSCVAVGSRDLARATAFADKFNIPKYYGSYEELVQDNDVDIVYIATPPSHHYEHMKLCIQHNKAILCEKAFTVNKKQAEEVIKLAKEKNLFLMEGLWTRFLPMVQEVKKIIDSEELGKATSLTVSMCHSNIHNPRVYLPELAGGTLLNLGVYLVNFASIFFGSEVKEIHSTAVISDTGVDAHNASTFVYNNGRVATLHASSTAVCSREGMICCEKGYIRIPNGEKFYEVLVYNEKHQLIRTLTAEPFTTGFEYQVLAVKKALEEGKTECEEMSHDTTLLMMEHMDNMRNQWGLRFPCE